MGSQTERRDEIDVSENLPPFTREDLLGVIVAIVGTLALILIAATSADNESGTYSAVTVVRLLLAIGASLINLAHVIGILFFESVDYHGRYQKLFSRLSLVGTPIALAVSLGVGLL